MRKLSRIFGKNKIELYFSIPLFLAGMCNALSLPRGYENSLWACGFLVASVFCVINALLDSKRMKSAERIGALVWFVILLFITIPILWSLANTRVFGPR